MLGSYSYDVGNIVQLVRGGRAWQIIWRGQLKVANPQGGWQRAFIYRIDNGHWDCYYEEELHSA